MPNLTEKDFVVIVQCHIVKERCPGYLCEKAFTERSGGFAEYPTDRAYRVLTLTCGGCCGRALHRKLSLFLRTLKQKEGLDRDRVVVQLSSCITKENFHAPPCPHLDYLKALIKRLDLDMAGDTVISATAEKRRQAGVYPT
jgi:predicted metal-binding protein